MHPELLVLPWGGSINAYGTLILLGGLLAMPGVWWDAKQRGIGAGAPLSFVVDFYLVLVFGAAIGGRVLHVLTMPAPYLEHPSRLFDVANTGFVFFGSLIFIVLGWIWLARRYGLAFGTICDIGATWMALGHAFGRLGCLMAGCCWGAPTDAATGISFPPEAVVFMVDGAPRDAGGTVPLHPTQLYETIGLLAIFVALLSFRWRRGIERQWRQASRYAIGYGLLRASTEILRGDLDRGFLVSLRWPGLADALGLPTVHPVGISISQAAALGLVVLGIVGLRRTLPPTPKSAAPRPHRRPLP
jgi:phosphatidylglycerol:prolipoprotein diacylglycerol transferase